MPTEHRRRKSRHNHSLDRRKTLKVKFLRIIQTLILFFALELGLFAQTEGTFTDSRDGNIYKTITYSINKKGENYKITWMAENLNFISSNSSCVNDSISNCSEYGRLYTWFEAKKVCPEGWRLPSDKDWNTLADLYGGLDKAGKHLKTKGKNKGTNKSLFNGLLGGARDPNGVYFKFNTAGFFWSSTESKNSPDEASDWSFASWSDKLRHWEGGKLIGNSCRCVKDQNK